MEHIYFFYFVITFIVGSISLSISLVLYYKERDKLLGKYILLFTPFTMVVLLNFIITYLKTNTQNWDDYWFFSFLDYLESPVSLYSLLFTVPYFFHSVFNVRHAIIGNKIIGYYIIIIYMAYHYFSNFSPNLDIYFVGEYLEDISAIGIIIYSLLIGVINFSKLNDVLLKRILKWVLLLLFLYLPGLYSDTVLSEIARVRFYPIFYIFLGVSFNYYFLKKYSITYLDENSGSLPISNTDFINDKFFTDYTLSPREIDVVKELLTGKSYQEIADILHISLNTVKTHVRNIYPKLNVKSRHELSIKISKESR